MKKEKVEAPVYGGSMVIKGNLGGAAYDVVCILVNNGYSVTITQDADNEVCYIEYEEFE